MAPTVIVRVREPTWSATRRDSCLIGVGGRPRTRELRPSSYIVTLPRRRLRTLSLPGGWLGYPLEVHFLRGDALYIPRQARLLHCPNKPPRWIDLPRLQAMLG